MVRQAASLAGGWNAGDELGEPGRGFASIAEGLRKVVSRVGAAYVPVQPSPQQLALPLPRPALKGRADFLASLGKHLASGNGRATAIVARRAVHGLGGVGEARAAVEYAWEHEQKYSALLFVRPRPPRAGRLATWPALGDRRPPLVNGPRDAVLRWLEARPGWLLILDNVDTEARLARRSTCWCSSSRGTS